MGMRDVKAQVARLVQQRDRTGKEPQTKAERVQLLNEIYDGLLFLWKQCVLTGSAKGTGSIALQLERARLEIDSLEQTTSGEKSGDFFDGIDFTLSRDDSLQSDN